MKSIAFILYLFLIAFFEVILRSPLSVQHVYINIAALCVLSVALYKSEMASLWFGAAAGLIWGASNPESVGWHVLALASLGFAANQVRDKLNLESLWAKILLVFAGTLIHNFLSLTVDPSARFGILFLTAGLGGAIYTTMIASAFFLLKDGWLTTQRLRELF